MATGRTVQASTLALLKKLESVKKANLKAYPDTKEIWTIGYGATWYHTWADRVKKGDTITEQGAENLLKFHAEYFAKAAVNRYITVPLTQNQFDSILSFAFNYGEPKFIKSGLVRLINENPKNFNAITAKFATYENKNRRIIEAANYAKLDSIIQGVSAISVAALIFAGITFFKS
jgi:GH24 family phage-related lysozyme (muramidase)